MFNLNENLTDEVIVTVIATGFEDNEGNSNLTNKMKREVSWFNFF